MSRKNNSFLFKISRNIFTVLESYQQTLIIYALSRFESCNSFPFDHTNKKKEQNNTSEYTNVYKMCYNLVCLSTLHLLSTQ